jgi:putative colanic acid biosynthesis acetyltransferase WcaF
MDRTSLYAGNPWGICPTEPRHRYSHFTVATDSELTTANEFHLSAFRGDGYEIGRGPLWVVGWIVADRLLVRRVYCPAGLRVAVLRLFGARIGEGVLIRHGVQIHWPWKLSVGDHTWIGVGAWLLNLEPITIGSNVCISQQVLLCTGSHDRRSPTFEFDNGPITIEDCVWLAARSTVLRGVRIGRGSTIGAAALITNDVDAGSTMLAPSSRAAPNR